MASPSIKAVQLILVKLLEGLSAVNQRLYYVLDKVYLKKRVCLHEPCPHLFNSEYFLPLIYLTIYISHET